MSPAVHGTAARGFGGAAAAYDRGRPDYPDPAIDLVTELLRGAPAGPLLDVAAGTGILTAALVRRGLTLVAVEPVASMRRRLAANAPSVPAMGAVAEHLPVRDGTVGAIAVAQAYHWFDARAATDEAARVMCARAPLIVVFNVRDPQDPVHAALDAIWEPYRRATPTHRDGSWRTAFDDHPAFPRLELATVPHVQVVDADGLVDRVISVSFIAALPDGERERVAARTRELVARDATVSLPYRTHVWWTRRRG